jgi:hypothetical protein
MRARLTTALAVGLVLTGASALAAGAAPPSGGRLAVLVGANAAAPGRSPLLYSHRDAERMAGVLAAVGGFARSDILVLRDPRPDELLRRLTEAIAPLEGRPESLLYFYYSGHADAGALYPGGQPLPLDQLRGVIDRAKVSVKIGVMDACRGGAWTRAKGLSASEPFEVKWPVSLDNEGSVLIASSSGLESAHESDELQGSFFTFHFSAGLRGAADRNGNGEVTLTEAFEYAKERTIRDTLATARESQRPSYALNLRGRRDLVLAQVGSSRSILSVSQTAGPLELIHADSGVALLELMPGRRQLKLAVPAGSYLVRKRLAGGGYLLKPVTIQAGVSNEIAEEELTVVGHARLTAKGGGAPRWAKVTGSVLAAGAISCWMLSQYFGVESESSLDKGLYERSQRYDDRHDLTLGMAFAFAVAAGPFVSWWLKGDPAPGLTWPRTWSLAAAVSPDGVGAVAVARF